LLFAAEARGPTLDDLFRKTKAKPPIYYVPLTDEEVAQKQKEKEERERLEKERLQKEREEREKKRRRSYSRRYGDSLPSIPHTPIALFNNATSSLTHSRTHVQLESQPQP
jgi:hypothetical protein